MERHSYVGHSCIGGHNYREGQYRPTWIWNVWPKRSYGRRTNSNAPSIPLHRLHIGIADGMTVARLWECRYS